MRGYRITAGAFGGTIQWEVAPGLDLTLFSVKSATLTSYTGSRAIAVVLDKTNRVITYTVARGDVNQPGNYDVLVQLASGTTRIESSTTSFTANPPARR